MEAVSRKPKRIKRKFMEVSAAASQRGKLGLKFKLIVLSDNLPPKNAPMTKEIPAIMERVPKCFAFACSVWLKSLIQLKQTVVLLAKIPVISLLTKRK